MKRPLSRGELLALYDEQKEKLPPDQRLERLNRRLQKQVRYAYRNASGVKEIFDAAGVSPTSIRTIQDLEKLPVTTKDDLADVQRTRPPFGGFLAVPPGSLGRIYVSPGPIYDAWGPERIYAQLRSFVRVGFPKFGDVVLVSQAYHMVPAGLCMTDALDMMGCAVVPAGTGQTELQVKLLHDLQPTAIFGFPSFVMSVLEKAEQLGFDVRRDFNLKFVPGGGERHIQTLRKVFEEKYGLVVGDAYGTADAGLLAFDCGRGEGYHFDDEVCVIEIVDLRTGKQVGPLEMGQVVVTLFSRVYPLVRFGTGDLATYTDDICGCGRSAPRITAIQGMVGGHVRVKGMFVHLRELENAMSAFAEITDYQMVLGLDGHKDRILLNIEVASDVDRNVLTHAVNQRCQDVFKLRMDEIQLVSKGTLQTNGRRFVDSRWAHA